MNRMSAIVFGVVALVHLAVAAVTLSSSPGPKVTRVLQAEEGAAAARGENSGRRLAHVGVVRSLRSLGGLPEAPGNAFKAETEVSVEKGWRRENLRAVVFAQERGTRRVLAAGSLKLFE